jgi:EAL domain-containing protein (putative c-di-GMP-specific phosphodiesterase class I)/GGDEF domain-containing protein/GAF domain-containing protein
MTHSGLQDFIRISDQFPMGFLIVREVQDDFEILAVNKELVRMCGCRDKEEFMDFTGRSCRQLIHPADFAAVSEDVRNFRSDEKKQFFGKHYLHLRTKKGGYVFTEDHGMSITDPGYGTVYTIDVTENIEQRDQNVFDSVTGLSDAKYITDWVDRQDLLETGHGLRQIQATICINISGFRRVNEAGGFQAGNAFLKKFGELLKEVFETSLVVRVFSDYFTVFTFEDNIPEKLEELQRKASLIREGFHPGVQAGVYLWKGKTGATESFIRAESALHSINGTGKVAWCFYSDEIMRREGKKHYISEHIDEALNRGWIEVWLQPMVRSLTGEVCSFEALSRWRDPVYGMISPGEFVPVLERDGVSWKLAAYVIPKIGEMISDYEKRTGRKCVPVSFNLSREDFAMFDPFNTMEETVRNYGIERSQICVEITESTVMSDPDEIKRIISRFHDAGYEVWMDDFGSAYSSLNVFKDYDFDQIKLDMAFLQNLNDKGKVIIRNNIMTARDVGVRTLCEGVETREQLSFLRDAGCEIIQGFYFSRPLPYGEIEKKIHDGSFVLESEDIADLLDSISGQPFMQNTAWCVSVYEKGKLRVLYQSLLFRQKITGRHLIALPENGLLRPDGAGMMAKLYQTIEQASGSGELVGSEYREAKNIYQIYARPIAMKKDIRLYLTTVNKGNSRPGLPYEQKGQMFDAYSENPIAIFIARLIPGSTPAQDDVEYLFCNEAYCRMMEKDRTEIVGHTFREIQQTSFDDSWLKLASKCVWKKRKVEGRKFSIRRLNLIEYTMVPLERERCFVFTALEADSSPDEDGETEIFVKRRDNSGIINEAVTNAIQEDDPDQSINVLISSLGESLQADRIYIYEMNKNGDATNTYEWDNEGVRPAKEILKHIAGEKFRNSWGRIMDHHQSVTIRNLDEYAAEEPSVAEALRPQKIDRLIAVPLFLENRQIGFLGIDNPPIDSIAGMEDHSDALAGFASALLRHRDNAKRITVIHHQEHITNEAISLAMQKDNSEESLEKLLSVVGDRLHADRSYIFEIEKDGSVTNTYEWCRKGVKSEKDNLQHSSAAVYENVFGKVLAGKHHAVIQDVHEYARKDPDLADILIRQKIDRLIAAPLYRKEKQIGFIGLDNPDSEDMENAALLLDMVAGFAAGLMKNRS